MTTKDTRERILDAAEELIGERGYSSTTLRAITEAADVNIAAVNYHFGSKEDLLMETIARCADAVCEERLRRLAKVAEMDDSREQLVKEVLRAVILPAMEMFEEAGDRAPIKIRFFGRISLDPTDAAQSVIRRQFSEIGQSTIGLLHQIIEDVPLQELVERFHWMIGTKLALLTDPDHEPELKDPVKREALAERFVAFLTPGFLAPAAYAETPSTEEAAD